MAKLVEYGLMSTTRNGKDSCFLSKAMCEFCRKKYGSIEEARKCELKHLDDVLRPELNLNNINFISKR